MGDIVIKRDQSEIWWTGQPDWRPIDEANPPRVPVGAEVHFLIRFVNQGRVTRSVDTRAAIADPVGRMFIPSWYPEPVFPHDLAPGVASGRGFYFITQTPRVYSLHFEVLADGALSDWWTFPACIAVDPAAPEREAIGVLTNMAGIVLVAELMVGLAEVMAEGMVEMMR